MTVLGRTFRPVIDHKKCEACSVCSGHCPAEIMLEMRQEPDSLRGRIYSARDQEARVYCEGRPRCQTACPLGQDVAGYIKLIVQGRLKEAFQLIRETNPLPSVCGYVCDHPCELSCTRGLVDEPLAIKLLKRFVCDYERVDPLLPARQKTGKGQVSIIGSGPSGLAAAHELAKIGYRVDILESYSKPGGMLAWAIPEFRLPRDVINRDIEYIMKMGVGIQTGVRFGHDVKVTDLEKRGTTALIVATGTQRGLKLNIEGELKMEGYFDCLDLLRAIAERREVRLGEKVLVIGGGNAALDTARSALRAGATNVTILYRRGPNEMPADRDELKEALREGVGIDFFVAPTRIISSRGRVAGLECVKTELRGTDDSGRGKPCPVKGSEFTLKTDSVIAAIGQEPEYSDVLRGLELKGDRKKSMAIDENKMSTNIKGVFVAGDFVTGPTSVVQAMASGIKAARAVDLYLAGAGKGKEQ
ncbi:MAG: FAD-dependent oxidoreductase [Deltaproteobacteria bacterium]|nr:FAD-dependent oxidoreductase [Deltaproteobacteria bacterium]MBW1978758.1 FAD-dependent oxidoreductase [Deltaproteobacteria bacterium]MBW2045699.1 FAD-dependent oxidoreductase [Deltaproteobacteria bacterium]MBW2301284.1 FAD-dependent oxidoreductase [Deltaproteobacteria bacterium]